MSKPTRYRVRTTEHRVEGFGGSWAIPASSAVIWALSEAEARSEGLRRAHLDRVPPFRSLQRQSELFVTAVVTSEDALF